jgi:hypothetical protein
MSDRFVVSMNFISKGLKSGCRKNSICTQDDSNEFEVSTWRSRPKTHSHAPTKKLSFCALNTKITISVINFK